MSEVEEACFLALLFDQFLSLALPLKKNHHFCQKISSSLATPIAHRTRDISGFELSGIRVMIGRFQILSAF